MASKGCICILVRSSSTRLPYKWKRTINGVGLLCILINRLTTLDLKAPIFICTSDDPKDDEIVGAVQDFDVQVIRGKLDCPASRMLTALHISGADYLVRLTGDNPFIDTSEMQRGMVTFEEGLHDYGYWAGLPVGARPEIFGAKLMHKISSALIGLPKGISEYLTYFVSKNRKVGGIDLIDLSSPAYFDYPHSLSIDTISDLHRISDLVRGSDPTTFFGWLEWRNHDEDGRAARQRFWKLLDATLNSYPEDWQKLFLLSGMSQKG